MVWEKKGKIFDINDLNKDWMETHTQLPIMHDYNEELIRLYFSTRKSGKSLPAFVDLKKDTFEIVNISSKPLLELGKPGMFDDSGVMFSSLVKRDGQIYMYYIGWNQPRSVPYQNSIGLAISEDNGDTFHKLAEGPLLGRSYTEPYFVASPNVIKIENVWVMYYLSCTEWLKGESKLEPKYNIKYAISDDGINWSTDKSQICINYKNEHEAIAQPCVIFHNGIYKMWYSTRNTLDYRINKDNSYRIGYAESKDGFNWIRKDHEAGIHVSETGWDSEMLAYGNVFILDNQLLMFYNGNGFGQSGIGYAVEALSEERESK